MSNVVCIMKEHLRTRSGHRRARSSTDACGPPNPTAWDSEFMRARGSSLRQRALAEQDDDLVVSSPKDKNFHSLPWDALRDEEQLESFPPTPTPISEEPRTLASAEYTSFHGGHSFNHPKTPPISGKAHRRATRNPVAMIATSSATYRSSVQPNCMAMTNSKSDPGPDITSISNINGTNNKPPEHAPAPKATTHRPTRIVDTLAYQPQPRHSLPQYSQPKVEKPSFIELPRHIHLPPELHVHTPEYLNALKQWFPAMAETDPPREKKKPERITAITPATSFH